MTHPVNFSLVQPVVLFNNDAQLADLPNPLLIEIFIRLANFRNHEILSLVNRRFCQLSKEPRYLAALVENPQSRLARTRLDRYLKAAKIASFHVKIISLSKTRITDLELGNLINSCSNIEIIK